MLSLRNSVAASMLYSRSIAPPVGLNVTAPDVNRMLK